MIPFLFLYFIAALKVFKKTTPNGIYRTVKIIIRIDFGTIMFFFLFLGKVTVYVSKRDFIDHLDSIDPIDGVVVVENDYLQGRKIFGMVKLIIISMNV